MCGRSALWARPVAPAVPAYRSPPGPLVQPTCGADEVELPRLSRLAGEALTCRPMAVRKGPLLAMLKDDAMADMTMQNQRGPDRLASLTV